MFSVAQCFLVLLFVTDSLEIRNFRRRQYVDDCKLAPNVLAPDLPENCHELNVNENTGPREVVEIKDRLDRYPSLITTVNITGGQSHIAGYDFIGQRQSLENISIVGNNIPTFPSHAFSLLTLKNLDLRRNNIMYLGLHPFDNSTIQDLNLNENSISSLLKTTFATNISRIRLAKNRVSFMEAQCFPNSLVSLDLSYNLLYDIDRGHFSNLENLIELFLSNNHLLNVDFTNSKLKALETLDLSFNQITNVNEASFVALMNLKFLNLTKNEIKRMSPATLEIFARLKILDVSFNRFSNFPYNSLSKSVVAVNHFGNPWNCECFFRLERYLAHNKIKTFKCDGRHNDLPFCVSYGDVCTDIPNESLITVFVERTSPDLLQFCVLSAPGSLESPKNKYSRQSERLQ